MQSSYHIRVSPPAMLIVSTGLVLINSQTKHEIADEKKNNYVSFVLRHTRSWPQVRGVYVRTLLIRSRGLRFLFN